MAWSRRVDAAIKANMNTLPHRGGMALVALGSYARDSLCPASDIDLLLLHDGWGNKALQALVQAVCYPLWDAGRSVGHSVLTAREAVQGAGQAIERATSLIDRRFVAGDHGLLDDLSARMRRWLRRHRSTVMSDLADADRRRHARDGPEPGMLEPDLKNSAGGLRDIDSLRWAAACLLGEPTLDALVGARYLAAVEHRELREAAATLWEARCALHLALGATRPAYGVDVLRLDVADEVAGRLGHRSADQTLRQIGLAMRAVRHVHGRTWPRLLNDARHGRRRRGVISMAIEPDLLLIDGLVEVAPGIDVTADQSLPLRAVAAAAARATHIGRSTSEALRRGIAESQPLGWNQSARTALLRLLGQGRGGIPAFADADRLGIFEAMLPGWSHVRGHPQRNPYHRYDVDTHQVHAVAELVDIAGGALDPRHAVISERLSAPDVVLLGTFLHDIGKPWPGDHSVAGAKRAERWVLHMGFSSSYATRVAQLVRHHLLLPEVATGRDLDDPDEIRRVAELVSNTETLDALLLLSLADARATGPSAYSAWKDNLLNELHARVRIHLTRGPAGWDRLAGPDVVAEDARRIAGAQPVNTLLSGMDRRYLLAATAEQVAAHVQLADTGRHTLRASWRDGPTSNTAVITIVAPDRRGLVADCAGVVAGYGVAVHEARAFTRDDGVAFDWFVIGARDRATGVPVAPDAIIDALHRLGEGTIDVRELVAQRERRPDERLTTMITAVEITVSPSRPVSRIEVRAPDTPGVLYGIARMIADANLDLAGARASTLEGEVRDIFFITDADRPALEAVAADLRAEPWGATAHHPRSSA